MVSFFQGFFKSLVEVAQKPSEAPPRTEKVVSGTMVPQEKTGALGTAEKHLNGKTKNITRKPKPLSAKKPSTNKVNRLVLQAPAHNNITLHRISTLFRRLAAKSGMRSPMITFYPGSVQFAQNGVVFQVSNLPIQGNGMGEISLRDLLPYLKGLNKDSTVTLANGKAVFECNGRSREVILDTLDEDLPTWKGKWITTPSLGQFLSRAAPFTENSNSRYALSAIHMEDSCEIVATTGKYLIVLKSSVKLPLSTINFPGTSFYMAQEINTLQAVSVSRDQVALRGSNWLLILPEEQRPFPRWRSVFPKGGNITVNIDPALLSALRSECKVRKEHTLFEFNGKSLRISSKDYSPVEVPCISEPWEITLDPKLLSVVLRENIQELHYYNQSVPLICTGKEVRTLIMSVTM